MPVTVYIWPARGAHEPGGEAYGHASLSLGDGTHISWWPQNPVDKNKGTNDGKLESPARMNQTLQDDIEFEGVGPKYQYRVGGLNEAAIKKWWMKFRDQNRYDLINMNCSTVVYKALCEGSPAFKGKIKLLPWTPEDIKEIVEEYLQGHPAPTASPGNMYIGANIM